jgi:TorA maturation chaperone TorD
MVDSEHMLNTPMNAQAVALNLAADSTTPRATPSARPVPAAETTSSPTDVSPEDAARAGVYALLAALMRDVPTEDLLTRVRDLEAASGRDAFAQAWERLRLAAASVAPSSVDDEYHQLFIGLGRGELVPYGSWYQTGFLMERPLSQLRDDLSDLGFERSPDVREPEDHVAALYEVMASLAADPTMSIERQRAFRNTHLSAWIGRFWRDLEQAEAALFYRSVGRLGVVFSELEQRCLSMDA